LTSKLGARVIPFPEEEPIYGLAARLARKNGASLPQFTREQGLSCSELLRGWANQNIAELYGVAAHELDRATFRISDKNARLRDEELLSNDWSYRTQRICADCVCEDIETCGGEEQYRAHVRAWWDLPCITVCPIHEKRLLTAAETDCAVVWDETQVAYSFAFPALAGIATTIRRAENLKAESYVLGRLGFLRRTDHPVLDRAPLWRAIRLMERVGVAKLGSAQANTQKADVSEDRPLSLGFAVLADGIHGVIECLREIKRSTGRADDEWAPRASYGRLYSWLAHQEQEGSLFDEIREAMQEEVGLAKYLRSGFTLCDR